MRRIGPRCAGCWPRSAEPLKVVTFDDSDVALGLVGTEAGQAIASAGPLTPDQIVYCKSFPLWFEPKDGEDEDALVARLRDAIDGTSADTRFAPKVVLVQGVGLFAAGDDFSRPTRCARSISTRSRSWPGPRGCGRRRQLPDGPRSDVHRGLGGRVVSPEGRRGRAPAAGRLTGKVAVVTGAAQGFGLEIAQDLAAEGATWC